MGLASFIKKIVGGDKPLSDEEIQGLVNENWDGVQRGVPLGMPRYARRGSDIPSVPALASPAEGPVYAPSASTASSVVPDGTKKPNVPTRPYYSPPPEPDVTPATAEELNSVQPVKRQPLNMAQQAMLTATPQEETTRPRALNPAPTAPPPVSAEVVYGPKGQPLRAEGGADDFERDQAYLSALEHYKPKDHNGRIKSALIGFGRAYLRGGGLAGAITGGVQGIFDPGADERYQNEVDIGKTTRAVAQTQASRSAASKLENEAADRTYKAAQAERVLNPVYAPTVQKTPSGLMNVQNGKASPIYDPTKPGEILTNDNSSKDRFEIRHDPKTGKAQKWKLGTRNEPDKLIPEWSDSGKDLVKVGDNWVPQGTAVTADALRDSRQYQRGRDVFQDERHQRERDEDIVRGGMGKDQERDQKAAGYIGIITASREAAERADAVAKSLRQQLSDPYNQDKAKQETMRNTIFDKEKERDKALQEGTRAAAALQSGHADLYEAGVGQGGFPYYKLKPFSVSKWRTAYPKATSEQEKQAIQNATNKQMEVVP